MFKIIIDRLFALFLLLLLSPLFLLIYSLLYVALGGNPIFTQLRPGKYEVIFRLIKFRTMTNERDQNGDLLPDKERLTPIGKLVRSSSLDELPQLMNVLKGEMSFVGPRPLLIEYLSLYNDEQKRRHDIKPGITGWAQVNGRNAISWEKKFELDVWYVDHQSFSLDIRILWMTLLKVVGRDGISSGTSVSMEKFIRKN